MLDQLGLLSSLDEDQQELASIQFNNLATHIYSCLARLGCTLSFEPEQAKHRCISLALLVSWYNQQVSVNGATATLQWQVGLLIRELFNPSNLQIPIDQIIRQTVPELYAVKVQDRTAEQTQFVHCLRNLLHEEQLELAQYPDAATLQQSKRSPSELLAAFYSLKQLRPFVHLVAGEKERLNLFALARHRQINCSIKIGDKPRDYSAGPKNRAWSYLQVVSAKINSNQEQKEEYLADIQHLAKVLMPLLGAEKTVVFKALLTELYSLAKLSAEQRKAKASPEPIWYANINKILVLSDCLEKLLLSPKKSAQDILDVYLYPDLARAVGLEQWGQRLIENINSIEVIATPQSISKATILPLLTKSSLNELIPSLQPLLTAVIRQGERHYWGYLHTQTQAKMVRQEVVKSAQQYQQRVSQRQHQQMFAPVREDMMKVAQQFASRSQQRAEQRTLFTLVLAELIKPQALPNGVKPLSAAEASFSRNVAEVADEPVAAAQVAASNPIFSSESTESTATDANREKMAPSELAQVDVPQTGCEEVAAATLSLSHLCTSTHVPAVPLRVC